MGIATFAPATALEGGQFSGVTYNNFRQSPGADPGFPVGGGGGGAPTRWGGANLRRIHFSAKCM